MKHLTEVELNNILKLQLFLIENSQNVEESLKNGYRTSIKNKRRLEFINFHFSVYKTMGNSHKMQEAFNAIGIKSAMILAEYLPPYRDFMTWLSSNTGRPLDVKS